MRHESWYLDREFPPGERLPVTMEVSIRENPPGTAVMDVDKVRTGDPLTDNNYREDGYRFHDVFHLANIAHLGWSPVHRALMRRRRRSDPRTAIVEDGRRAISLEEGLTALLFSYASRRRFLEGATGLEPQMLRTIREMTERYEVNVRTRDDWTDAVLEGYRIWRLVREWKGADLTVRQDLGAVDVFRPT